MNNRRKYKLNKCAIIFIKEKEGIKAMRIDKFATIYINGYKDFKEQSKKDRKILYNFACITGALFSISIYISIILYLVDKNKFVNAANVMIICMFCSTISNIIILYPAAFMNPCFEKIKIKIDFHEIDSIINQIDDQNNKKNKSLNFISIALAITALFTQDNSTVITLLALSSTAAIVMTFYNFSVISAYKTYLLYLKAHNDN